MLKHTMAVTASMLLACGGSDAEGNDGTEGSASPTGPTVTSPSSNGSGSGTASDEGTTFPDDGRTNESDDNPVFDVGMQPGIGLGCVPGEPDCPQFRDPEFEA